MGGEHYILAPEALLLPNRLQLRAIKYQAGNLQISVFSTDGSPLAKICFDRPLIFTVSDEGERMRSLDLVEGLGDGAIFVARDSAFKRWIKEESYGVRETQNTVHYVILTADEWIDVLAWDKPSIASGSPVET